MQCASSITISPAAEVRWGSTLSRKPGLLRRSGLTSSTSTAPSRTSAYTCCQSSRLAELIVRAWMPARAAASTWFRISASSGETITVGPAPAARSSAVATKYTADLPHPVRCTTSARRFSSPRARIAVHWSSRSRAFSPASARRWVSAASRSSRSSLMTTWYQVKPAPGPDRIGPGGHRPALYGPVGHAPKTVVAWWATGPPPRLEASIRDVTDTVSIRDLRVATVIGVYDWERETEQALVFAVDMAAHVARAASRDN